MKRGCDLLILLLKAKVKRSQPRFTRQLLQSHSTHSTHSTHSSHSSHSPYRFNIIQVDRYQATGIFGKSRMSPLNRENDPVSVSWGTPLGTSLTASSRAT